MTFRELVTEVYRERGRDDADIKRNMLFADLNLGSQISSDVDSPITLKPNVTMEEYIASIHMVLDMIDRLSPKQMKQLKSEVAHEASVIAARS